MTAERFWSERFALVTDVWRKDIADVISAAEFRRMRAGYNTGSITATAALALRALTTWAAAKTIIEVGTFIGTSTHAMQAPQIYTCDVSNDCLPTSDAITCFPHFTSTRMFTALIARQVKADFWFFDGLLSQQDVALIHTLSAPEAVYVFDDFNSCFKGVQNINRLQPTLPQHVLFGAAGPIKDDTTLGILVPVGRLC